LSERRFHNNDRESTGGIVETFATRLPGDEGYDILSKLSVSSLHQIKHVHGSGARPSVAAMVGRKVLGDQSWEPTSMSPFINKDPNREQATL
jgi:hypothetical protein